MDWRAISLRMASVKKPSPAGPLLTGETGGLTRLHPPPIKQKRTIAPTEAKLRIATSSGRRQTGTGGEAKLKLNMVRLKGRSVYVCVDPQAPI